MRIRDWSSDVCSSDLGTCTPPFRQRADEPLRTDHQPDYRRTGSGAHPLGPALGISKGQRRYALQCRQRAALQRHQYSHALGCDRLARLCVPRSEEHTSELQSLMRISYAVFCLKKKNIQTKKSTSEF